jgi:hypothetical protein
MKCRGGKKLFASTTCRKSDGWREDTLLWTNQMLSEFQEAEHLTLEIYPRVDGKP